MSGKTACPSHYTRELYADSSLVELHIRVDPKTDLDGKFTAYCCDEHELLSVNGWLFSFEDVPANKDIS
ncbi:hypothetical protein NAC44_20945 [Allorhizobium sp. BGMRC 0089]|uniref:hypothetical protein n=1 Tax=Allorhizobium sonneratiae TaxID=2934936 RepID=UPI002033C5A0|nr:hypothetical protein [Allorhizobium sonneratiae]MCM2294798.1 hypothetical protein [Allorhizobium sonneratiae]